MPRRANASMNVRTSFTACSGAASVGVSLRVRPVNGVARAVIRWTASSTHYCAMPQPTSLLWLVAGATLLGLGSRTATSPCMAVVGAAAHASRSCGRPASSTYGSRSWPSPSASEPLSRVRSSVFRDRGRGSITMALPLFIDRLAALLAVAIDAGVSDGAGRLSSCDRGLLGATWG